MPNARHAQLDAVYFITNNELQQQNYWSCYVCCKHTSGTSRKRHTKVPEEWLTHMQLSWRQLEAWNISKFQKRAEFQSPELMAMSRLV